MQTPFIRKPVIGVFFFFGNETEGRVNRKIQGEGMKEGLAEEARWRREGVQMESWAARAEEGSRADGRMRGLIKPYYHRYYHCHDHRNHTSDEAYYVKR